MFEWLTELKLRLRALLLRRRLDNDLEDELAFHVGQREAQLRDGGNADPARAARLRFGNASRLREECRELWTFAAMERFWADVKYAHASFSRNPGFTAMVVLTLALGIGTNAAVFSVVRAVLLRPLPYSESDRLAFVWRPSVVGKHTHSVLTGDDVIMVKERNTTLESFAVLKSWEGNTESRMDLLLPDGSERLRGAMVSPNFFELLGTKAVAGRVLLSSDNDAPVAVLSRGLWQRRFGEDTAIIGRQIRLAGGRPRTESIVTIVGVLPDDFRFTYPIDTEILSSAALVRYPTECRSLLHDGGAFETPRVAAAGPGGADDGSKGQLARDGARSQLPTKDYRGRSCEDVH
jgi:hypothetical protein